VVVPEAKTVSASAPGQPRRIEDEPAFKPLFAVPLATPVVEDNTSSPTSAQFKTAPPPPLTHAFVITPDSAIPKSVPAKDPSRAQLSMWCKTFNNVTDVADKEVLAKELVAIAIGGETKAALSAGEAEAAASYVGEALSKHYIAIAVVTGGALYLTHWYCSEPSGSAERPVK
jgi:hypothetical protein